MVSSLVRDESAGRLKLFLTPREREKRSVEPVPMFLFSYPRRPPESGRYWIFISARRSCALEGRVLFRDRVCRINL